jgi:hypothetical protein
MGNATGVVVFCIPLSAFRFLPFSDIPLENKCHMGAAVGVVLMKSLQGKSMYGNPYPSVRARLARYEIE